MKYFRHGRPYFAWRAVRQQLQTGHAFGPPTFRDRIVNHACHISCEIRAGVFKIAEQIVTPICELAEIDRIVADVAAFDDSQDIRPDFRMQLRVGSGHAGFGGGLIGQDWASLLKLRFGTVRDNRPKKGVSEVTVPASQISILELK